MTLLNQKLQLVSANSASVATSRMYSCLFRGRTFCPEHIHMHNTFIFIYLSVSDKQGEVSAVTEETQSQLVHRQKQLQENMGNIIFSMLRLVSANEDSVFYQPGCKVNHIIQRLAVNNLRQSTSFNSDSFLSSEQHLILLTVKEILVLYSVEASREPVRFHPIIKLEQFTIFVAVTVNQMTDEAVKKQNVFSQQLSFNLILFISSLNH